MRGSRRESSLEKGAILAVPQRTFAVIARRPGRWAHRGCSSADAAARHAADGRRVKPFLGRSPSPLAVWLAGVALGLLACDRPAPVAAPRGAGEFPQLLGPSASWKQKFLAWGQSGAAAPTLHLRVHRFEGELVTAAPLHLDRAYRLRFLPMVRGLPDTCEVSLDALAGERATELWRGEPHFTRDARGSNEVVAPLERTATVSLRAWRGQSVGLRWRISGSCAGRTSWIANPQLLSEAADAGAEPSILLVCSDQHRYDRAFGEHGAELMPTLRDFGDDAVVYTHAFSNASWTLPSIASTLTGLYPRFHRTGLRDLSAGPPTARGRRKLPVGKFAIQWGNERHVLNAYPRQLHSLAERLRHVGYDTAAVVSNAFYTLSGLTSDGFDLVIDTSAVGGALVNRHAKAILEQRRRRDDDRPLFLLVHYMDVHEYLQDHVPAARSALQKANLDPEEVRGWYDDAVRSTDRNLAALLSSWGASLAARETLIAFYSDHGEHLQEPDHRHDRHGDSMDEVLLRIPLAIRYPKRFAVAPHRETRPVTLVDLVPTLLEVAGAPSGNGLLHGTSLLALGDAAAARERPIFADYQLYDDELSSVRHGSRKLVVAVSGSERVLIDTERAALTETEAQARIENPETEAALTALYRSYVKRAREFSGGLESDHVVDPDEVLERLRDIGYVE